MPVPLHLLLHSANNLCLFKSLVTCVLIHTHDEELIFALSDLILDALSLLLEHIPTLDLRFQ
jgi:hypothetical protein